MNHLRTRGFNFKQLLSLGWHITQPLYHKTSFSSYISIVYSIQHPIRCPSDTFWSKVDFSHGNAVHHPSCVGHKLFTFLTSSQEWQNRFWPNMRGSIIGWRGFRFVHMKGLGHQGAPQWAKKWENLQILNNLLLVNNK